MSKIGVLKQAASRRVQPDPSGIVSPSEVGIRKLIIIKKEPKKGNDENGSINNGKANEQQLPDLENRDPRSINAHIAVNFEDVLGEHDGVRSLDCCWIKYKCCYTCCKNLLYKCTSLMCGFPLAAIYGCMFAFMTFPNVWILTPCSKAFGICCTSIGKFLRHCALCIVGAPCESCGQLFWAFNTKEKKRPLMAGKRTVKVTFSDKIRTKRIPARTSADKPKELTRFQIIRMMSRR